MKSRYHLKDLRLVATILLALALLLPGQAMAKKRKKKQKTKTTKKQAGKLPEAIQAKSPKHDRDFWYYVPTTYKGKASVPLVFSYHGASGTGKGEIRQWKTLAEKYGFIVACPTSRLAGAGQRAGKARSVSPQEFFTEAEAALSIVRMMKEKFKINQRLVLVTGFSGGGNPSYWLGFVHSNIFPYLCTRCGNFPSTLGRLATSKPEISAAIKLAAQKSHILVLWGERDHPIILREIPNTLKWLESLKAVDLALKKVPGMRHESRPALAADWFMQKATAVMAREKKAAKVKHKQLLAAAHAAYKKKDYTTACENYFAAASLEQDFASLGNKSRSGIRRVNFQAKTAWRKIKSSLKGMNQPDKARAIKEFTLKFPGTDSSADAAKLLE